MSGILLWAAAFALAALLAIGIVDVGAAAVAQTQASAAADAAALAGAAGGRTAAETATERNGATLISFDQIGDIFTVTVQRNGAIGVAYAERSEVPVSRNAK